MVPFCTGRGRSRIDGESTSQYHTPRLSLIEASTGNKSSKYLRFYPFALMWKYIPEILRLPQILKITALPREGGGRRPLFPCSLCLIFQAFSEDTGTSHAGSRAETQVTATTFAVRGIEIRQPCFENYSLLCRFLQGFLL